LKPSSSPPNPEHLQEPNGDQSLETQKGEKYKNKNIINPDK
jgi:hypothetical protein